MAWGNVRGMRGQELWGLGAAGADMDAHPAPTASEWGAEDQVRHKPQAEGAKGISQQHPQGLGVQEE